jgi:hypothetical protein
VDVAFFTRRGGNGNRALRKSLDGDMHELERLASLYTGMAADGTFDLLAYSVKAFETAPTRDLAYLIGHGCDGHEFHARELAPNWSNLSREQRASKIATFVKFANLLAKSPDADDEAITELGATVRSKVVLLATAYDETYADDYCRQIARNPGSFGDYELPNALTPH